MKISGFFEKLKLDNKKTIAVIIFSLIILCLDYSFILQKQLNAVKSKKPALIKLKDDIALLNKNLSEMNNLKTKQGRLAVKDIRLVSDGELPGLLADISNIANNNKISIMQIKPSQESKAKKDALADTAKNNYRYISLSLSGAYHEIGRFVNDLENANTFIAVEDFKITNSVNDSFRQEAAMILRTYVKK